MSSLPGTSGACTQFFCSERKWVHPDMPPGCGTSSRVLTNVGCGAPISVRQVDQKAETSAASAGGRFVYKKYRVYRVGLHHCLNPPEFAKRLDFWSCFLKVDSDLPNFSKKKLWTEEPYFARGAEVNSDNSHMRSTSNHYCARSARKQHQWTLEEDRTTFRLGVMNLDVLLS